MKTKLILITCLMALAVGAWAQSAQRLVVWKTGNTKVYFDLAEEPETTFADGQLVIKTTQTTVYYPLTEVLRYTYEGNMTAIDSHKLRPGEIRFMQGTDQMAFDGLPDGTQLEVYSLDGKKLFTRQARGGQRTVLSLANYPKGTYLVKVGDATYKFMNR